MKKKFVSLLLAAALVFSLGVPAFADEGTEALPAEPEAAVPKQSRKWPLRMRPTKWSLPWAIP